MHHTEPGQITPSEQFHLYLMKHCGLGRVDKKHWHLSRDFPRFVQKWHD